MLTAHLESLIDLRTPWCIHVAVTLHVAEHIAAGVDRIDAIAAAEHCDSYVLHCVLATLVRKGVFEEPEPGRFALNDAARRLLEPTMRIALDLHGIGGRMAGAWGTLLSYVRTGQTAYHEAFGQPFWADLESHPAVAESFDALIGPGGHGHFSTAFPVTGGWQAVRSVVDVGGGTGAMLAALLEAHPHLTGTLVDLPRTVARAVVKGATIVGQSFFEPLPRGADIYLLRGIINDWPNADAVAILKRCAEAARPQGRVVVLKSVQPGPSSHRLEIEMVLAGGRIRTLDEFRPLAAAAGLEIIAAGKKSSDYFVVECRPV